MAAPDFNIEKEARFNSGIAKLLRIGKLREGCHDGRLYKNYPLWLSSLRGMRSEINAKLTKVKTKKGKEIIPSERERALEFEKVIRLFLENKKDVDVKFNGRKINLQEIDIDDWLYEYELWLGDMEEKYKWGMPDEMSAYDALR